MTSTTKKQAFSMIIGMIIAMFVAEIVINCLLEISYTSFFAVIFGIALIVLGGIMIWRNLTIREQNKTKKYGILLFAIIVACSGLFSILSYDPWSTKIPMETKPVLFACIGLSLTFSITYTIIELINMGICTRCAPSLVPIHPSTGRPLPPISSVAQISVAFIGAIITGFIYGLLYGLLDIEGDPQHIQELEYIVLGISAASGLFLGFLINYLPSAFDEFSSQGLSQQQDFSSDEL